MRTKKKTVGQEKNRNSQKSVKSVRLIGMGVYGGKDFWKRYVFSLEWKSEGVMDDDSGALCDKTQLRLLRTEDQEQFKDHTKIVQV